MGFLADAGRDAGFLADAVWDAGFLADAAVRDAGFLADAAVRDAGFLADAAVRDAGFLAGRDAGFLESVAMLVCKYGGNNPPWGVDIPSRSRRNGIGRSCRVPETPP